MSGYAARSARSGTESEEDAAVLEAGGATDVGPVSTRPADDGDAARGISPMLAFVGQQRVLHFAAADERRQPGRGQQRLVDAHERQDRAPVLDDQRRRVEDRR